ncbi:MAG TPA: crosslink repair DNA glycosylase YcaQ family protein, partial [Propionibacteriaceae bacterium]|nr:crosslink repair DNA glycosylase YcaQ family protein [Propionibacteriaceae bacterium]
RLPAALSGPSDRVAMSFTSRIARALVAHGITTDPDSWLGEACRSVEAAVVEAGALSNVEIRERVPLVRGQVPVGSGTWSQDVHISPWVCTLLSVQGRLLRGEPTGRWTAPRPRWHPTEAWLGEPIRRSEPRSAFAELVRLWLERFGPGTADDIVWWLGATKGIVRTALADVSALEVGLDDGGTGYVLPDDADDEPEVEPWAALLPVLDATTMGWKGRGFYLDAADVPYLFDTNGNAGTTAWWDGRIVGCWVQDDAGRVRVLTRHALPKAAVRALRVEEERLTTWLGGTRVRTGFSSRQLEGDPLE